MTAPVQQGEILAGKYRVDRVLGVGGMGVVVAAHHIDLDQRVAIKFLLAETLGNAEAVTRFAREARAAVKIRSEHVARVSDVGKLENGAPYMVMEYLEGGDLAAWVTQRGPLPVEQAVEFVLQACEAIAEAHALGIVHRDLKPANLFVIRRADGVLSVKVLDFGISKMTSVLGASSPEVSMTSTTAVMGSPLYMSPEQMRSSKEADARADIWALGVILYELLTAEAPFLAETMPELVARILAEQPPPLRNKRPDVPDGVEAVILKCLEKDRGKRYQTIGEFALALLPFGPKRSKGSVERISGVMRAAGLSGTALALPPSSDPDSIEQSKNATAASWGKTNSAPGGGRLALFGITGAAMVLGIVAATFVLRPAGKGGNAAGASATPSTLPLAPSPSSLPSPALMPAASVVASASANPPEEIAPTPAVAAPPIPVTALPAHKTHARPAQAHEREAVAPSPVPPPAPPPAVPTKPHRNPLDIQPE